MKKTNLFLVVITAVLVWSCSPKMKLLDVKEMGDGVEKLHVRSSCIADNSIGENPEKEIYVLLPEGYAGSDQSYPVIYYLHGYQGSSSDFYIFETALRSAGGRGIIGDFIFVGVDGSNQFHGCFYVNSDRTGRWEDYIVDELVPLIDSRYRTLASSDSRGLAGFSMGGFGALYIGLRHPDVFGSVYAMGPGVFAPGEVKDLFGSGPRADGFSDDYINTFSPAETYPVFDGSENDNAVIAGLESGFGDWSGKLDAYLAGEPRLKALHINYGVNDIDWIKEGCIYLEGLLKEKGIPFEMVMQPTQHRFDNNTAIRSMLPFFAENLEW